MTDKMRQCELRRIDNPGPGVQSTVGWIPAWAAKIGDRVRLLGDDARDLGLFEVLSASSAYAREVVQRNARDYRRTRGASDI